MKMITEETTQTVVSPTAILASTPIPERPPTPRPEFNTSLPHPSSPYQHEEVRHILIGSPEAIRQTIHQLHVLDYAESLLWSPITTVGDAITITQDQGEAMSLLRRPV
ncbi:MAG: hypothetical protein AAFN40_20995 [Cyanobacteria bacterium J06560_6]